MHAAPSLNFFMCASMYSFDRYVEGAGLSPFFVYNALTAPKFVLKSSGALQSCRRFHASTQLVLFSKKSISSSDKSSKSAMNFSFNFPRETNLLFNFL